MNFRLDLRSLARRRAAVAAALAAVIVVAATAWAQTRPYSNAGKAGAKGYDVVAYFTDGKATKGQPQFTTEHAGVRYQFASAANRDAFKGDPAKYAPQYGGYCAWGVAKGGLYDVDPEKAWSVVDGKLYLNYDASVKQTWSQDIPGNISKADANWPKLAK
jgi:YHS domain-containing protein